MNRSDDRYPFTWEGEKEGRMYKELTFFIIAFILGLIIALYSIHETLQPTVFIVVSWFGWKTVINVLFISKVRKEIAALK